MSPRVRPLAKLLLGFGLLAVTSEAAAQSNDLQAGGLAPPPPSSGPPSWSAQPTETERLLEEADRADSGRGLEMAYFDLEGGGRFISLEAFGKGGTGLLPSAPSAPSVETSGFGASFGAGAGVRLLFATIGPRFRLTTLSDWDFWTLGGEVGVHIPLGNLEPYFTLGAGYAKVGYPTQATFGKDSGVSLSGLDFTLGGGADYYLTNVFSIGARANFELLLLKRGAVDPSSLTSAQSGPEHASAQLYAESGSGTGFAASASLVLGLHF